MGTALRFKQSNVPKQNGEQARLKVIQGPDYGSIYVIMGGRASIGRGEENDVIISDLKASRVHAEIRGSGENWMVRDLASANGILVNGQQVKEARLKLKDVFKIGETTLEFVAAEAGTMMLVAPPRDIHQLQMEQAQFEAQRKRARGIGQKAPGLGGPIGGAVARKPGGGPNKRIILYGGAGLVLLVLANLPSGDPKKPSSGKKKGDDADRSLSSYLPKTNEPSVNKAAEMFFKTGLREYRERNFTRAKVQFETVLQIAPGHRLATFYLQNCEKSITEEVKKHLEQGKQARDAGKLKEARGHYEAVLRLMYRAQSEQEFVDAKNALEDMQKDSQKGETP